MTTETVLTEEQLVRQATDALIDKLGIVEATRFLSLRRRQRIESIVGTDNGKRDWIAMNFSERYFKFIARRKTILAVSSSFLESSNVSIGLLPKHMVRVAGDYWSIRFFDPTQMRGTREDRSSPAEQFYALAA